MRYKVNHAQAVRAASAFAAVVLSAAASAEIVHEEMVSTYTGTDTKNLYAASKVWKNRTTASADAVAWKSADDYAVFPSGISTFTIQLQNALSCYGLLNETDKTVGFSLSAMSLGAGGIRFTRAGGFTFGYYNPNDILTLTADQVWEGANVSGTSVVSIGYEGNFHKPYTYSRVSAAAEVSSLTLKGRMAGLFYSPDNRLGGVDVRVEAPAELVLADATVTGTDTGSAPKRTLGRLNAKSVVLAGDGVRARFGSVSPVVEAIKNRRPKTTAIIDAATLAAEVTLDAGADLVVSNTTFALEKLSVTGEGKSVISGAALTFTNAVTEFAVADGSCVALSVDVQAGTPGAKVSVTGPGTLELADGFKSVSSLAGIDVASAATLSVTVGEPLFIPVSGSGKITVALAEGAETYIDDLSAFTGPVEVVSGTLYLPSAPVGGVTTSGSGSVRYDGGSKYVGVAAAPAGELKVGAGETLLVGGDGLTAATRVWMNGGTLKVVRSCVIAATVTQDVTSVYAVDDGVSAEFAGAFVAHTTGTSANIVKMYGGEIGISGGFRAEGQTDQFYLYSGRLAFSGEPGYFCGDFGIAYNDLDKTIVFDDVVYEATYKGGGSPQSGLGLRADSAHGRIVICNGAALRMLSNRRIYFSRTELLIDGGTFTLSQWGDASFRSSASIVLKDGSLFSTGRRIGIGESGTIFDWQGGTFKPAHSDYVFNGLTTSVGGVRISGSGCVLDMSGVASGKSMTNYNATANAVPWTGTDGAKLTVKGPGRTVLNGFNPGGMSIELAEKADILFPSLKEGFVLDELVINGLKRSISTEETSVKPAIGTVRIGAEGLWTSDVLDAFGPPAWTNMVVETDAILKFSPGDAVWTVPGTLTFGENVRTWIVQGSPSVSGVVMTSEDGISGSPETKLYDGHRNRRLTVRGNDVIIESPGLKILLR